MCRLNYFKNLLDSRDHSTKNIWYNINRICSYKKQAERATIAYIQTNQGPINNKNEISNTCNNYFSTIGPSLDAKIDKIPNGFNNYLKNPIQKSMFLNAVTENEVHNAIMSLRDNNSTGSDCLTTKTLKLAANFIKTPLSCIINLSFSQGVFPTSFKTAKVIPIHKKGSKDNIENYRPISLLSNLSKIFERLMYNRLYDYLHRFKMLYNKQFDFRKGHSTVDAVINSVNMIRSENGTCYWHIL